MPGYLLDTNSCILLLRSNARVIEQIQAVDPTNCFISEISVAELLFGAEKSQRLQEMQRTTAFIAVAQVLPISDCLREYARQRWRLQQQGQPIDDFDLLIGATAIAHSLTMVTNNTRHFQRLSLPFLEDWTQPLLPDLPGAGN